MRYGQMPPMQTIQPVTTPVVTNKSAPGGVSSGLVVPAGSSPGAYATLPPGMRVLAEQQATAASQKKSSSRTKFEKTVDRLDDLPATWKRDFDESQLKFTGETGLLKDYFDTAVYRNILTALGVFDDLLVSYRNALYNNMRGISHLKDKLTVESGAVGFAISQLGKDYGGEKGDKTASVYNDKLFKLLGLSVGTSDKSIPIRGGVVALQQAARDLGYEMNRVRLPMPFNLVQMLNKLENPSVERKAVYRWQYGRNNFVRYDYAPAKQIIKQWESIPNLVELFKAADFMRGVVRREIDAANLAPAVQEETIRSEADALATREEAERQAAAQALAILRAKESNYLAEYDALLAERRDLDAAEVKVRADYDSLSRIVDSVGNPAEVPALVSAIQGAEQALAKLSSLRGDLDYREGVLIDAIKNLQSDNAELLQKAAALKIRRESEKSAEQRQLESDLEQLRIRAGLKQESLQNDLKLLQQQQQLLTEAKAAAPAAADQVAIDQQLLSVGQAIADNMAQQQQVAVQIDSAEARTDTRPKAALPALLTIGVLVLLGS